MEKRKSYNSLSVEEREQLQYQCLLDGHVPIVYASSPDKPILAMYEDTTQDIMVGMAIQLCSRCFAVYWDPVLTPKDL